MMYTKHQHRGFAHFMVVVAWLLFFAILMYFFTIWLNKEDSANPVSSQTNQMGMREVVLKANRKHHYLVFGKVNGVKVIFLVDTGASDVVVPSEIADEIGLVRSYPAKARTAAGDITVYLTRIDTLDIGVIHLQNIRASINPAMKSRYILLGMSALKKLELMQRDGQLIMRQHR